MDWSELGGRGQDSCKESKKGQCVQEHKNRGRRIWERNGRSQKKYAREQKGRNQDGGKGDARRWPGRASYIGIFGIMILLNIMAWNSRRFCDWYIAHIFRIWVDTYGRVTGMVPFSVGEILIGLGAALAAAGVPLSAACLAGRAAMSSGERRRNSRQKNAGHLTETAQCQGSGAMDRRGRKEWMNRKARKRLERFGRAYCRMGAWLLLGVFVLMTLNCYILYHGSDFAGLYLKDSKAEYTLEDLEALRNFVAAQCNALCRQMPRNADGTISYPGDMAETAKAAMKELGETYSCLSGFYPTPKPLYSSDFMSQQYVAGCFFPFSMEANYNTVMYVMNMPSTMCHELAHLKGFIREDEANLVGYLACVGSEDIYFNYSGYLSVLYYIDNDFQEAAGSRRYQEQLQILPQVHADNIFLSNEERDRIEKTALWDTRVVDAVSDSIADASLRLNGVEDGMISYSNVVELLLRYYDVCGYP